MPVEAVINNVMTNPDVAVIGLAVGFLVGKMMQKRKMRRSGGMGMGGGF